MEAWDGIFRSGQGEMSECPYSDVARNMLWNKMTVAAHDIEIDRRRLNDLESQISKIKENIRTLSIVIDECDVAIKKLS